LAARQYAWTLRNSSGDKGCWDAAVLTEAVADAGAMILPLLCLILILILRDSAGGIQKSAETRITGNSLNIILSVG
jgi:hypothetical protein